GTLQIRRAGRTAQPDLGLRRVARDELDLASTGLEAREPPGCIERRSKDVRVVVRGLGVRSPVAGPGEGRLYKGEQSHGTGAPPGLARSSPERRDDGRGRRDAHRGPLDARDARESRGVPEK